MKIFILNIVMTTAVHLIQSGKKVKVIQFCSRQWEFWERVHSIQFIYFAVIDDLDEPSIRSYYTSPRHCRVFCENYEVAE